MNGPRLSAWQLVHSWLTDSSRTIVGLSAPCGLWQLVQASLPSRIGWCEGLSSCARISLWQLVQVSYCSWREVVTNGVIDGLSLCSGGVRASWITWQLSQATSFL